MWGTASILVSGCLAAGVSFAQGCTPPEPFGRTTAIRGNAGFVDNGGGHCDLVATLAAGNDVTGAAFAYYSLPQPNPHWRFSFRVDTSQLGDPLNLFDRVSLLSASARVPYPLVNGNVALAKVLLFGPYGGATSPELVVKTACTAGTSYMCSHSMTDALADGDLVRLELTVGAGAAGELRWWINAGYDEKPSGTLGDLDNAPWQGVQVVALGAFEPSARIALRGATLTFRDIESFDDTLFWSGFEY